MYVRWSRYLLPTRKEAPADAETPSQRLMPRAGLVRKVAPGAYAYLPFGHHALRRVEEIVREEMQTGGGLEVGLPTLPPHGERGPGEPEDPGELIPVLAVREISSWRDMPLMLFRIGEGPQGPSVLDAFCFHATPASLERGLGELRAACSRILARCGLSFRVVEGPPGPMGGRTSQRFVFPTHHGGAEVALCPSCGYAADRRVARIAPPTPPPGEERPLELVPTPGARTVDDLVSSLGVSPSQVVKTFLYVGRDGPMAVLVRGDRELEEAKLFRAVGDPTLRRVDDPEEAERIAGAPFGFLGPVGLSVPILADAAVRGIPAAVVGGNREGFHYIGAKAGRDFRVDRYLDLHRVREGDPCGRCGAPLRILRGTELGELHRWGTECPGIPGAVFTDRDGEEKPIAVGRCRLDIAGVLEAAVAGHHDEEGIVWPVEIAPFQVVIAVLRPDIAEQLGLAERLAGALDQAGFRVLLDDRDRSPGEKFHDAKLTGIPVLLVVGPRGLRKGEVEAERRRDGVRTAFPAEPEAVSRGVRELLRAEII